MNLNFKAQGESTKDINAGECLNYNQKLLYDEEFIKLQQITFKSEGCCIFSNFFTQFFLNKILKEIELLTPLACVKERYTNPYKTEDDPSFPIDHPVRFFQKRTNTFITQNNFHHDSLLVKIYKDHLFKAFLSSCIGQDNLYEFNDGLNGLVLNILYPGCEHAWHFDDPDSIAVLLMVQPAQQGGYLEISPNIRSVNNENYSQVKRVLEGDKGQVRTTDLCPGELIIFHGGNTLHRVTSNLGNMPRYTILFSYSLYPEYKSSTIQNKILFS